MQQRRGFLKTGLAFLSGGMIILSPFSALVRRILAETGKIILPRGTNPKTLVGKNPAELDARNLEITPLKEFGTMGQTDLKVDLKMWKLAVTGSVQRPREFSYEEVLALPPVERQVLMICPGVFVNHGAWKGISLMSLLNETQAETGVTHVTVRGPAGSYQRTERYPIADVVSNKVFLAYEVNGERLPNKHGFPLRIVAEGYYGYDWLKYVHSVVVEKIPGT